MWYFMSMSKIDNVLRMMSYSSSGVFVAGYTSRPLYVFWVLRRFRSDVKRKTERERDSDGPTGRSGGKCEIKNAMNSNKFEETASLQSGRVLNMAKKNSTNSNGLTNYVITNYGAQSRVVQARCVVIDSNMRKRACQNYSLFIIRSFVISLRLNCSTIRDSYLFHQSSF